MDKVKLIAPDRLSAGELKKIRRSALLHNRKKVPVQFGSGDFEGADYETVYSILFNSGFKKILKVSLKDICTGSDFRDDEVMSVEINGDDRFGADDSYPYDAVVVIRAHTKKRIKMQFSSADMKGQNAENVLEHLRSLGFTRVRLKPVRVIGVGWNPEEGTVERVTAGGAGSFEKDAEFDFDTDIELCYHAENDPSLHRGWREPDAGNQTDV